MSVNSLVELCRHEEELHVETWVMFSPSELGQHYRNWVSDGEYISKGNIHAEKTAVFPNVLYSLCASTFMNQNISYHRTSSWKTLQGNNILLPSCKPYCCVHKVQSWEVSYYHLSCSCYLVTELLRPLKCFCCFQSKGFCSSLCFPVLHVSSLWPWVWLHSHQREYI